jgi:2-haloacid dehalogenase
MIPGKKNLAIDFSRFTTISFDCYGTLIDWESGILATLRSLFDRHQKTLSDEAILELYGEFEADAELGSYESYRIVLESVVRRFGKRLGFQPAPDELRLLHESVSSWLPFPDTGAALARLQQQYKLAVISNIDDDLMAETRKHLAIEFDFVITAQQAQSYKPSLRTFQVALERMELAPERLLHAGQSVYHDIVPAHSLGIASVWVNRKSARAGIGAVRPAAGRPTLAVPDLASLAALAVPG